MNPERISNLFNIISQAHASINYYHCGWQSDINITVPNNFTIGTGGTNPSGKKYPSLTFDFNSENWDFKKNRALCRMQGFLIFNDAQGYTSADGSNDPRSIVEVQTDLQAIALDVATAYNSLGRSMVGADTTQLSVNRVMYNSHQRADRLVEVILDVTIEYLSECSTFEVDINTLRPPFNILPPTSGDYELKTST